LRRALLIAAVSLVLLAGGSLVTLFDYSQDTGLSRENQSSKIELSRQTRYLQALEDERHALQAQLDLKGTGYNSKIVELESKIMDLEEQIEKLQDQLKRQNYIAVGLTFSWKRELNVDASSVANVVDGMDDAVWDRFHVYFFVFHAQSRDFMPTTVDCSGGHSIRAWANEAWTAYPERDIPIGVFSDVGRGIAGCVIGAFAGYAIAIGADELNPAVLTHELLHVFGFSDEELAKVRYGMLIPPEWSARIQTRAKWFQMRLPQ